jgi:hypothetical protein
MTTSHSRRTFLQMAGASLSLYACSNSVPRVLYRERPRRARPSSRLAR